MRRGATAIQAGWRGMQGRAAARRERAAVVVQAHVRGRIARLQAHARLAAIAHLQRCGLAT